MIARSRIALASLAVGLLALAPLSSAQAAGYGATLKSAAQARVTETVPNSQFAGSSIRKVMGQYATVAFTPAAGGEDLLVLLRKSNSDWIPVAGPSATFMPSVIASAPPGILSRSSYLALRLQAAVDTTTPARQYSAGGLQFRYPDTATVEGQRGAATITGNGYRVVVSTVGDVTGPFDEWAYDAIVTDQLERYRSGSHGGMIAEPFVLSVYSIDGRDLLEVNWERGDTSWHEFFTQSNGVGYRVLIDTNDDPAAFQAASMVLQSVGPSYTVMNGAGVAQIAIPR